MNKNKLVACMLGTILLLGNTMPVLASESQLKVLTLEKAIKQAKQINRNISANERQEVLSAEEVDFALLVGDYNGYKEKYVSQRYVQKQGTLLDSKIEIDISTLFDEIIVIEKELEILGKNIEIEEKKLKKQQVLKGQGMTSELDLEGTKLVCEQMKDSRKKTQDKLELKYSELCTMIGSSNQKYVLEKDANIYKPYQERGDINAWVNTAAEEHINIWKATEDVKVAELPSYTSDYMLYIKNKEKIEQSKDKLDNTEEIVANQIRQIYTQVRQLEAQYELITKKIEIQEKQVKVNESYLLNGLIAELEYDQAIIELKNTRLELEKLVNNHTYLKKQLNNPSLISIGN